MTAPGSSVTMEEIGEQLAAAAKDTAGTDPSTVKLEGDKIPEAFRGKTVAELLRDREVLAQSLDIANSARKAAEANVSRPTERVIEREAPPAETKLTKEQLASLFESDPIGAVAYMQDVAIKEAAGQFERRFAPLAAGSASNAEAAAKAKFATEFELFEREIKEITDAMPDKSLLSNPVAWENVVAFVRGKSGNFEKLLERRGSKAAEAAAAIARDTQDRSAGASLTSTVRPVAPTGGAETPSGDFGLAQDERRAADVMNMSYKEYAHWKKIGG